jgi:hypothetical protein
MPVCRACGLRKLQHEGTTALVHCVRKSWKADLFQGPDGMWRQNTGWQCHECDEALARRSRLNRALPLEET